MNFQTNQICLSYADSDNVIFQQETENSCLKIGTASVIATCWTWTFFVEHLTRGVEQPADVLAEVRDFALDSLLFCCCFIEQTSCLVFCECVACALFISFQ